MTYSMKTAPSLLACDFLHLADEVQRARNAGADWLHCDVMDGVYVPNISFGFDIIGKIHSITDIPLDVHMMTAVPEKYLETLARMGAYSVTIHSDVMERETLAKTLDKIHALDMKAGVALKPGQSGDDVTPFLPMCDMVLVMTVEPGFGGQKFMPEMLSKIREIRSRTIQDYPQLIIQVDGGIGESNIGLCAEAGADCFVVGTSSFRAPDMQHALESMKRIAEEAMR